MLQMCFVATWDKTTPEHVLTCRCYNLTLCKVGLQQLVQGVGEGGRKPFQGERDLWAEQGKDRDQKKGGISGCHILTPTLGVGSLKQSAWVGIS